jgi:Flp pilus assembly protein TadG
VEFMVAFMPLALLFFVFVQLSQAMRARLVLRHAANMGARTAAVVLPPNPGNVGKPEDVDRAVHLALGAFDDTFSTVTVIKKQAARPYDLVTVEVRATYRCQVPLGGRVMCGIDALLPMSPVVAQYPNQGARYVP